MKFLSPEEIQQRKKRRGILLTWIGLPVAIGFVTIVAIFLGSLF
ncbi:hypothetical protein AB3N04_00410 (plasmid) [Alkalihalophilus sp. As8PL]|uniref:Uncharacterized protein n=1 Tax=Alkalihalophilus sp. As8PL TaxID=3237103 RepID=A0AB39BNN7_9BACI